MVAAVPHQALSGQMAFDPISASTTRVSEHREPVFVHDDQEAVAQARLEAYITRTGRRPNVLVILFDDVGWGDFGCYGGGVRSERRRPTSIDSRARGCCSPPATRSRRAARRVRR